MTIKQRFDNSITNVNLTDKLDIPRIKAYQDPKPLAVTPVVPAPSSNGVSFEKQTSEPELKENQNETTVSDEEKRKSRREEWSAANQIKNRAIQAENAAKEKLAKAQAFQELVSKADADPIQLAKALGQDPTEFLRKYQNAMFNIKEEEKPKQEEDVKSRLQRYEEERQIERQRFQEQQANLIRQTYTSGKIIPTIQSDKEKFQLLNNNGLEKSAAYIYDIMNSHYQATGEELNVSDVAEAMEEELLKEFEARISMVKKIPKFSKHFREEVAALEEEQTPAPQLGARKTISSTTMPSAPPSLGQSSSGTKQHVPFNDKKARLERALNKFK